MVGRISNDVRTSSPGCQRSRESDSMLQQCPRVAAWHHGHGEGSLQLCRFRHQQWTSGPPTTRTGGVPLDPAGTVKSAHLPRRGWLADTMGHSRAFHTHAVITSRIPDSCYGLLLNIHSGPSPAERTQTSSDPSELCEPPFTASCSSSGTTRTMVGIADLVTWGSRGHSGKRQFSRPLPRR